MIHSHVHGAENTHLPYSSRRGCPVKPRLSHLAGALALRAGALFTMIILTLLILVHLADSIRFSASRGLGEFLTRNAWRSPAALLRTSIRISAMAVLFAAPWSFILAVYISEYADPRGRRFYLTILEITASVPAVVFGLFALMFVTPTLQALLGAHRVQPYNTFSAALVLGIFLTPSVTNSMAGALSRGRIELRGIALALGATRAEAMMRIVVPSALPGIASALIMGFSRAFGEAVVVGMVAGSVPNITANPFEAAETVSAFILRGADSPPLAVRTMGSLLFIIGLALNLLGQRTARRSPREALR